MLNVVVLMGRLVADPELRRTQNDTAVCSFRIAVDRNFVSKSSGERQTDFIDVVAWRGTGEFVSRYFTKGQMIAVTGSIQTRSYEDKQGNRRTAVEVVADNVSFTGSKRESGSAYGGDRSAYEDRASSYDRAPAYGQGKSYGGQDSGFGAAPTFPAEPPPAAFSSGGDGGFEEIMGDDDLPF